MRRRTVVLVEAIERATALVAEPLHIQRLLRDGVRADSQVVLCHTAGAVVVVRDGAECRRYQSSSDAGFSLLGSRGLTRYA
jgi:hypothetical protein